MRKIIIIALTLFVISACSDSQPSPSYKQIRSLTETEKQLLNTNNNFAFNLFKQFDEDQNVFISPLSIGLTLGMLMNGGSPENQESIINLFDFGGLSVEDVNSNYHSLITHLLSLDSKTKLGIANSGWASNRVTIDDSFRDNVEKYYDGKIESLDFTNPSSKDIINKWVHEKTNGRIKNLINGISPEEILFLVNAIYFKSNWTYKFDKSKTHKANFTLEDQSVVEVDMMVSEGVSMRYLSNNDLSFIEIPYGNGQFNLSVIVPKNISIDNTIEVLNTEKFNQLVEQSDSIHAELELPKFKMNWKRDLKTLFQELGMHMEGYPDLIEEPLNLEITRIIHQTFIDVNEEGTEAAAATAVGVGVTSLPPQPLRVKIDKPFIFFIREKNSGALLFMGKMLNPAIASSTD